VIEIATELAKAEINAKHAEQAADDAVKAAAKTAHDAVNAAEAKEAADSNLSAATEKAKHNTVIQAVKEEIVKQEESRLAAEKQAEAEKVSKDAAEKAAAEKAAAEKAAEIADAVTKALAEAKKTAEDEKEAALAEARKAAEADKAAAVAAAKAQAEVDKAAAADKAAADAAAAAQKAKQEAVDARAKSQNDLTNAALKDAADAAEQRAKEAETAKLAADAAADAAKQAVADAETAKLAAVAAADAAQQAAAKQTAAANAAEQRAAAAQQAVADAAAKQADADKRAAAAETAKLAAEQAAADAKQAADKRAADAVAAKEAAEQAADEAVARSAKTVQDLQIQLNSQLQNSDRLVAQYHEARDEISNLQAQLEKLTNEAKALADEANVYNPDRAFAALISQYKDDLRAAQSAKDAAAGTIKTLSSQIIVDNVRLDDDRYTLTEVRALADKNNHPELVKAIDAYSQYSFEFDTTNRVLASANELNVLSEVEGVEGKPSDAVARMINRLIAHKKTEALDRLLRSEESQIDVIAKVAEGFKGLKDIVDAYNSVKGLIDEDVSGTENDEDAIGTENEEDASGTEAKAPRVAEPAEELHVVHAKEVRNELIGQLQKTVEGFDIDTKALNDAALRLVSTTIDQFNGMLADVSDPYNPSDLSQRLDDLKKGLNAATKGRYESVYTLVTDIRAVDTNIQEWTKANDEINKAKKTDEVLAVPSAGDDYAYKMNIRRLESNKDALAQQLQTIIDSYADAPRAEAHLDSDEEEEAHASRIQNLTADTLGALKLALARYSSYLNSIKSRSDKDMLLQSDKVTCERIIAAYGLTLSNIDEDTQKIWDSREKPLASRLAKQEELKPIDDEINRLSKEPKISTALTVLDPANTSRYNDQERVEANKAAEGYFLLVKKKEELDSQITACDELVERIRVDYYWLANAYHDVKVQRRDLLLGGDEFVAGITTAITTILSPVPAAAEREYEYDAFDLEPLVRTEDNTDGRGALVTKTSDDSDQGTEQNVQGAFGGTGQLGGQTIASTVGFSADKTQTPPPPPPAAVGQDQSVDGASAGNAGNSTTAAQLVDDASAGSSGNSTPVHQPVAQAAPAAQLAPPAAVPAAVAQAAPPAQQARKSPITADDIDREAAKQTAALFGE